ncbi:Hint domain-containing protein [Marivita hallyeonensis]|uniref:Hint domain-containing protein n=1 Tax=Marivita hallyeonensis TaxID=996342 RepID=A0A1M5W3B1_9RHOB|nr:Hint domain-containing protein [Marivita hallyeonensis]SHH82069.1 Hint domain-containing protein [Marivita hallyeonensis]
MATTTLLLNGFSIVGNPQSNSNASNGGEFMLHDGDAVWDSNDIVAFVVDNVTVNGVLTDNSVVTQIIVYDNASDYYNDIAKYTYTGSGDIDDGRNNMGDRYIEFDASGLTSTDAGAPVLGELAAIAGVDILGTLASTTGPLEVPTNEDIDINDDGQITGEEAADGAFSSTIADGLLVICFARGTLIETPDGPRFIETLREGDAVTTLDAGAQDITWIGHVRVPGTGVNTPIRIRAGALGNVRDLWVSPNHRMLVRGTVAELLFGEPEVLVAAKHLVDGERIFEEPREMVEYWHFLCHGHQLVFAEGCASETLYPGQVAMQSIAEEDRDEILGLLPDVSGAVCPGPMARYTLKRHEAKALLTVAA